jgi:hypothetical protein
MIRRIRRRGQKLTSRPGGNQGSYDFNVTEVRSRNQGAAIIRLVMAFGLRPALQRELKHLHVVGTAAMAMIS